MALAPTERNELQLTAPDGVTAGGTATFKLPRGFRYHEFFIVYGGTLATNYGEMRVIANTENIHRYDVTERDMMNQTDKLAAAAGVLRVPMDSVGMRERAGEEETALNVGRPAGMQPQPGEITSAEIQIDVKAGAVSPSLKIYASVSPAVAGGAGVVRHLVKTTRSSSGAGALDIINLQYNRPNRAYIRRMFVNSTALDNIVIERDNKRIFERTKTLNDLVLSDSAYRSQQSGWTLVDKTERGYAREAISTIGAQDLLLRLNMTGAVASFPLLVEYVGSLTA